MLNEVLTAFDSDSNISTLKDLIAAVRFGIEDDKETALTCVKTALDYTARQIPIETDAETLKMLFNARKQALQLNAPYCFDSFMQYIEWNREPKARFWIPRRKVLEGKHKIATQIQEFIDDPNMRFLSISLPPGTGKSTLIKFLLAFIAGGNPKSSNMYVSYSDGMVKMMYDSVSDIMTNDVEYLYDEVFPNEPPTLSAEYYTITYKRKGDFPTIGMVSLGGSVTGRTRANKFLITDDLVRNAEMARSPTRLEKLWADYQATLTTRTVGENVKQIMLGTRWSLADPISRMERNYINDTSCKFIAIPVWDENEISNFEYDHPDKYTKNSINYIKQNLDSVDFSALYLQEPIEKEGIVFPAHELRYYSGTLPDGEPDNIFFYTDVAWGGGDSLSMPIAYQYGDEKYIHDVVFDRGDKFKTKPRVVGKIVQHNIRMGDFEANNGGDEYCDDIFRLLQEQGYSCNLRHQKSPSNMSKASRIEQHAPDIKNFYFIDRKYQNAEYRRFFNELTSYSYSGNNLHDDAADSMAGLASRCSQKRVESAVFRRPF